MKITKLKSNTATAVTKILERKQADFSTVETRVTDILTGVKTRGNAALVEYTAAFDKVELTPAKLKVTAAEMNRAVKSVSPDFMASLKRIINNITRYHEKQLRKDWQRNFGKGVRLGEKFVPIQRAGFYVPGGKAPLVSTVLMTAVPALVAGVQETVVCTPPGKDGNVNPAILAACKLIGIDEVYRIGGAQAIAAMAYGTRTIKAVDKIAGPGNIYVTVAKKLLYGTVGIDMPAGPSEVLIIADSSAKPAYVAVDLLAQVEHGTGDEMAILLSTSESVAKKVLAELQKQAGNYYATKTEQQKILKRIDCLVCTNIKQLMEAANIIGAEHVEVMVKNPEKVVDALHNAGAIFVGPYSPVPIGDFAAGPSHVLPTGGAARAFSGLSVQDFIKRISIIACDETGLNRIGPDGVRIAEMEGLSAHAQAIAMRLKS